MNRDPRGLIHGLDLDIRILASELYGTPAAEGGDVALATVDRMTADLERLREWLTRPSLVRPYVHRGGVR